MATTIHDISNTAYTNTSVQGPCTIETRKGDLRLHTGSSTPNVGTRAYHFMRGFSSFYYAGSDTVYLLTDVEDGEAVISK